MGKKQILSNAQGWKQSHAKYADVGGEHVEIVAPSGSTKYLGRAFSLYEYEDREINHRIAAGWGKFSVYKEELCNTDCIELIS